MLCSRAPSLHLKAVVLLTIFFGTSRAQDICYVCGGPDFAVVDPDFVTPVSTDTCGVVQENGLNGTLGIPCQLIQSIAAIFCGCKDIAPTSSPAPSTSPSPSNSPTTSPGPSFKPSASNLPTVTASPTEAISCNICGGNLQVRNPDGIFLFPGKPATTCRAMDEAGRAGLLIQPYQCHVLTPLLFEICDCGTRSPSVSSIPSTSIAPSYHPTYSTSPSATPSFRPSNFPTFTSSPTATRDVTACVWCFSKKNAVITQDRGGIPIADMSIGDYILTSGNRFEMVYSLGHYHPSARAKFVRLSIASNKAGSIILPPLEMSPDHMIFTAPGKAVMAGTLVPGDTVLLPDGTTTTNVISTKLVDSEGLYAPFTTSGTLVVNGVVVSSFTDVDLPLISGQWVGHKFEIPHRAICALNLGWCKKETYAPGGMSRWVYGPAKTMHWLVRQDVVLRGVVYVAMLMTLCVVSAVATVVHHGAATMLFLVGGAVAFYRGQTPIKNNVAAVRLSFLSSWKKSL